MPLDFRVAHICQLTALQALDRSLPPDLDVLEVVEVAPPPPNTKAASLADRLEASVWQVTLDGVAQEAAERAVIAWKNDRKQMMRAV